MTPQAINEDGVFTAVNSARHKLGGQIVVCPQCGVDRGLSFSAFAIDTVAVATCPNRHTWDERRMNGLMVRDLFLAFAGRPTRCTTITWTDTGEKAPVADDAKCHACLVFQGKVQPVEGQIKGTLADWIQHILDSHLGEAA